MTIASPATLRAIRTSVLPERTKAMVATTQEPFWAGWTHQFAQTAPGVRIHYVDVGPHDAPPVVLVHGWPDLWFGWRHQIRTLSSKYRLIVPDMRGFGQSSTPQNVEAYGSKNITSDLAALLDALDIQKAVFIGHDWGGAMVWRMCLFYPQRVLAACSVCTPYKAPMPMYIPLEAVVARVPEFTYHLTLADAETAGKTFDVAPRRFFTAMYRKPSEHIVREDPMALRTIFARVATDADDVMFSQRSVLLSQDELDYYVEQYSSSKFQSTCQFYATRKMDFESEVDLPAVIPHPVLFIAAAKDEVLKPEMARGMPQFIPNLETKLVEDAGHWVLWEQKEQVNALLAEWLDMVATSHDKV